MKNLPVLILLAFVALMFLCMPKNEQFSTSGLNMSDRYCQKMADVYYKPKDNNVDCRHNYRKRICGKQRRHTIDTKTGNYFMDHGVLV